MKVKALFLLLGGFLLLTAVGCTLFYPQSVYEHFVSPQKTGDVATPTFSIPGGTYYTNHQSVSISCATPGATIYYTLDGTSPTPSNTVFTTNLSVLSNNTTIKAIAVKSNMANSQVATATYTLMVATPTLSPPEGSYSNAQSVSISCATSNATIYYTLDGTTPTPSDTLFTTNLVISNNTTIKAIAVKSNMANSTVATATYTLRVATPTFSIPGGIYTNNQSVSISCTTPGVEIYYTLDGTSPTSSDTLFTTNNTLVISNNTTIKAIAVKPNMADSTVATATYTLRVATPTFSPQGGTYSNAQNVSISISCATPGATIYYTLNGTNPTSSDTLFTTNLSVFSNNTTIKAIAVKSNMANSTVATKTYSFLPLTWTNSNNEVTITGPVGNPSSIVIPSVINEKHVTSIGNAAFKNNTGLISITLPNSLTSIGDSAFSSCSGLTNITFHSNLVSIGDSAFADCTGLTNITFHNSLTSIGDYAFYSCTGLTNVTVQATNPPALGGSAFYNNARGRKIYVPSGSVTNYQSTGNWTNYASDIVTN